jgi:hypothetical protein
MSGTQRAADVSALIILCCGRYIHVSTVHVHATLVAVPSHLRNNTNSRIITAPDQIA